MRKKILSRIFASIILCIFTLNTLKAQCNYIAATSTQIDTLSYTFFGGFFASFGCPIIDPTYWLAGNGPFVTVNFVSPQSYPTFRVWGMNDDDSVTVTVNGASYPLSASSASYDAKVVCGISPGPDGVIFSSGKLAGTNPANYSYQNIQLNAINVSTFTVTGVNGAGWGYAGASVDCPLNPTGIAETENDNLILIYPNPSQGEIKISSANAIDELTVTDLLGRIIYTTKPKEKVFSLNFDNSGIYFLKVVSDKQITTSKLKIGKQ